MKQTMKKVFGVVLGALLICVGVISVLNLTGVAEIDISLDGWWTLFIILPAAEGLISGKDRLGSLCFLLLGVYLLLAARDVIPYGLGWKLWIPVTIILLGVKFIVKSICGKTEEKTDESECTALFCDKEVHDSGTGKPLSKVAAVFGGAKCDLSDAVFEKDSQISVLCVFGGAEIRVPEDLKVKMNVFCLFGGISDKRNQRKDCENAEQASCLTINGFCLFGGADIK